MLKQGAKLVESPQDIFEELDVPTLPLTRQEPTIAQEGESANSALFDLMGHNPVAMETLHSRCNLTVSQLSAMLLALELEGHVSVLPGGLYQRIH
ncbi:MAG TPA: hypothetical protein VGD24_08155 [Gallionella sp.]